MGEIPWGPCQYCKEEGPLRITHFSFPIKCNCCGPTHSERVEHCNKCEAKMPNETKLWVDTKKLQDPLHEGLFTKGAFI
jgi:hypothetical protein